MTDHPLTELLARIESAAEASRELDARLHHALFPDRVVLFDHGSVNPKREASYGQLRDYPIDAWEDWDGVALHIGAGPYTVSVDAALALVERVLPGTEYEITNLYGCASAGLELNGADGPVQARRADNNIPLAILAALVRALIAKGAGHE